MAYFYNQPENFLSRNSQHLDGLYNAISKGDTSEAVIAALDMLKKTHSIPNIKKTQKSEDLSVPCRETGNALFMAGDYVSALKMYNLAIGSAPKKSPCIVLAYSNRSALLQKIKAYSAALADINTCLSMRCPQNIFQKLISRKENCLSLLADEKSSKKDYFEFGTELFSLPEERHPEIPCASAYVAVVVENRSTTVVAAKEIPIGSVVAIETPFASNLDSDNTCLACHYCHKFEFNLIPCDTCCDTFFCSNHCKETCYNQYHNIECQLIDLIKLICSEDCYRIPLIAAIKMKNMYKTWEELITATSRSIFGRNQSKSALFDENNVHAVLSIANKNRNFVYGQKFNDSFTVATIIHYLDKMSDFFPKSRELKQEAIRTISRIIMHLIPIHPRLITMQSPAMIYPRMDVSCEPNENAGLFPFTGKLKHACEPNLLVLGLNNRVALVATKTIPQGAELTISYVGHWYDNNYRDLRPAKVLFVKPGCDCRVCEGQYSHENAVDGSNVLNAMQKEFFNLWVRKRIVAGRTTEGMRRVIHDTMKGIDLLSDKPYTKQYLALYEEFRKLLCQWQYMLTDNAVVIV